MQRLLKLGVRNLPVVAKGDKFVFGQNLEDVAEFVGLMGTGHTPLPPEQLIAKWVNVLRAAQRYVRQLPAERLAERVIDIDYGRLTPAGRIVYQPGVLPIPEERPEPGYLLPGPLRDRVRERLAAYNTDVGWLSFPDPTLVDACRRAVEVDGFRGIKIKLGGGELADDLETVRAVRGIIGDDVALMVDYNQSLDPGEAIRRIRALEPFGLEWVEEPVAAEDLQGHARVRVQSQIPIQTGENWWFPRAAEQALSANACDRMMPDLMKIGGITGWLSVMGLARAASMPVSSHLFIEASSHVLAVTPTCDWLEFMDFGSSVLQTPYVLEQGSVTAQGPGLGIAWDEAAIARHAVD